MVEVKKSERELLSDISTKLDRLVAVTAIAGRHEDEHVDVLMSLGVDPKIISSLTGLTTNAIAIRKTRSKKGKPGAKKQSR